jgi:Mor family transcriptional regulator
MPTDTTETPATANLTTDLPIDAPRAADPTLCADVACIFAEATRDRRGDGIFQASLAAHQWQDFSEWFALRLAARIGGRYIPKRDDRAVRDAAVWRAFTGRNHKEVMRSFQISRRLLYSILARQRKA